jgi:dienelactone hydrolase
VRYRTDAASRAEEFVLVPKGFSGSRPGAVVLHQTTDETILQAAGVTGREAMHIGLHLVRRGYVCVVPRNFLWSRPGIEYLKVTHDAIREGGYRTGMAKMLWDAVRATDLLAGWPHVDSRRIASIGHSLGGKEALYHAAFDSRIRAAVSCEGGIGLSFSNWDADWYLGQQIRDQAFGRDHHELLALIAPRAFLLIGGDPGQPLTGARGEAADGVRSWPYLEAALPFWKLTGDEDRLGLLTFPGGHDFPPPGPDRELVYRWLDHWLK